MKAVPAFAAALAITFGGAEAADPFDSIEHESDFAEDVFDWTGLYTSGCVL
jgi:hypothetical protein